LAFAPLLPEARPLETDLPNALGEPNLKGDVSSQVLLWRISTLAASTLTF
jgi:hypothetical protein